MGKTAKADVTNLTIVKLNLTIIKIEDITNIYLCHAWFSHRKSDFWQCEWQNYCHVRLNKGQKPRHVNLERDSEAKDLYSASEEDFDKVVCFFNFQVIKVV